MVKIAVEVARSSQCRISDTRRQRFCSQEDQHRTSRIGHKGKKETCLLLAQPVGKFRGEHIGCDLIEERVQGQVDTRWRNPQQADRPARRIWEEARLVAAIGVEVRLEIMADLLRHLTADEVGDNDGAISLEDFLQVCCRRVGISSIDSHEGSRGRRGSGFRGRRRHGDCLLGALVGGHGWNGIQQTE